MFGIFKKGEIEMNDIKEYMKNSKNKLVSYTSKIEELCKESNPDTILIFSSDFNKNEENESCIKEEDMILAKDYNISIPIEGEIEILINKMKKVIDEVGATYFSYAFDNKTGCLAYNIIKDNKAK